MWHNITQSYVDFILLYTQYDAVANSNYPCVISAFFVIEYAQSNNIKEASSTLRKDTIALTLLVVFTCQCIRYQPVWQCPILSTLLYAEVDV